MIGLVNSPSWIRFIGERNIKTVGDAEQYIESGPAKSYALNGFGLNCIVLSDGNIPIGMCGLIKRDSLEDVDIGFAFLPEYEGKGFAFESSIVVLSQARSLGIKRLVAITLPENEKSVRLLQIGRAHV